MGIVVSTSNSAYASVISSYLNIHWWNRGEAMKLQRVVPNIISYNALISACEYGKVPERALELR